MFIVGLFVFAASVGVGVYIKAMNQAKIKFKLDVLNFCDYLKMQIGFTRMPLKQIILNYAESAISDFKKILLDYADGLGDNRVFVVENKELGIDEASTLNALFAELGKSDVKRQVELCENSKRLLLNAYEDYKIKKQKAGDLGLRLSVCVGLLMAILLL